MSAIVDEMVELSAERELSAEELRIVLREHLNKTEEFTVRSLVLARQLVTLLDQRAAT